MNVTRQLTKSVLSIAAFLYIVAGLPAAVLALLLVTGAETAQGRIFGLAAVLAFPAPILFWLSFFLKKSRRWRVTATCLLVPALILIIVCYRMTPDGRALPDACADSVFTGTASYRRTSVANLVPEIDQLKLGTHVFPRIDPYIDSAQAIRIRRLFLGVYRDMRQSDDFNRLGSVLNYVYRDMFLAGRPTGHLYQYIPQCQEDGGRLPVILFLHGSLGNFKGYLWLWKRFADEHGYAIVAPSFGAGNWSVPGGTEAVEHARQYCATHPRMDERRIYIAGLSNGGMGVSRAAAENPAAYAGLIFISPVIEDAVISTDSFITGWKDRRVLVLHGSKDRRIPVKYVERAISHLTRKGVDVESKFYAQEDHFLLFSQSDQIMTEIASWLVE